MFDPYEFGIWYLCLMALMGTVQTGLLIGNRLRPRPPGSDVYYLIDTAGNVRRIEGNTPYGKLLASIVHIQTG